MASLRRSDGWIRPLRRIARTWSGFLMVIIAIIIISHIIWPDTEPGTYPPEENLLPLAMVLCVASLGLAWRWELLGGILNILFYLLNLLGYWLINDRFFPLGAAAMLGLTIVPGILFLICWRLELRSGHADSGMV
jgi:hypothetical protein